MDAKLLLRSTLRDAALSLNRDERKAAQQILNQLQDTREHLVILLQMAMDKNSDMEVRQIASIQFKNIIAKNWSPKDSGEQQRISPIDKEIVRYNILVNVTRRAPTLVRSQIGEGLKTIIYADYPEKWPGLLDWVKDNLKSGQNQKIYGALFVFTILYRKYEFESYEKRKPLSRIVEDTFPLVLPIFESLIRQTNVTNPSLEISENMNLIFKIFWSSINVSHSRDQLLVTLSAEYYILAFLS